MKINKIRPKFHFSTKIETKMTYLVFVFCYYCLFVSRAIWKPLCSSGIACSVYEASKKGKTKKKAKETARSLA